VIYSIKAIYNYNHAMLCSRLVPCGAWSFDEDEGGWEYRVCALISLELDTFPLAFENNKKKSLTSPPMR
jgi:hypothetical protein